jgi:hypothetical protein
MKRPTKLSGIDASACGDSAFSLMSQLLSRSVAFRPSSRKIWPLLDCLTRDALREQISDAFEIQRGLSPFGVWVDATNKNAMSVAATDAAPILIAVPCVLGACLRELLYLFCHNHLQGAATMKVERNRVKLIAG